MMSEFFFGGGVKNDPPKSDIIYGRSILPYTYNLGNGIFPHDMLKFATP